MVTCKNNCESIVKNMASQTKLLEQLLARRELDRILLMQMQGQILQIRNDLNLELDDYKNDNVEVSNSSINNHFLSYEDAQAIYQDVIDFYNYLKATSRDDLNSEQLSNIKTKLTYFTNIRDEKRREAGRGPLSFLPSLYDSYVARCEDICLRGYGIK